MGQLPLPQKELPLVTAALFVTGFSTANICPFSQILLVFIIACVALSRRKKSNTIRKKQEKIRGLLYGVYDIPPPLGPWRYIYISRDNL